MLGSSLCSMAAFREAKSVIWIFCFMETVTLAYSLSFTNKIAK